MGNIADKTKYKIVLVCVLKDRRDLEILLQEKWYRIPLDHMPTREFSYLAFYQPLKFGPDGKRIIYYAKILGKRKRKRIELLPEEPNHPRANDIYMRLNISPAIRLVRAIKNIVPRRITFGFTTLDRLYRARDILELYSIARTEQILEKELKRSGIKYFSQKYAICANKRFRPDFVIFCQYGKIAIECDNKKAHSGPRQKSKDKMKDACLAKFGWSVIHFSENEILFDLKKCLVRIKQTVRRQGAQGVIAKK